MSLNKIQKRQFFSVYVDSSDSCNALTFNMGQSGIGTGIPTRSWSIKASILNNSIGEHHLWLLMELFLIKLMLCFLFEAIHICILFFQITQISCYDSYSLAPSGCTQYFAGTSGMFQSYNYANLFQLANQKQRTCFRYGFSPYNCLTFKIIII